MIDIDLLSDVELAALATGVSRINKARIFFQAHMWLCEEILAEQRVDHARYRRQQFKAIAVIAQALGVADKDLVE